MVVPQMAEQRVNAARVADRGLGVRLPRAEAGAQALRDAVVGVAADDRITAAVKEMRRDIESAGGVRAAADVVEAMLPATPNARA